MKLFYPIKLIWCSRPIMLGSQKDKEKFKLISKSKILLFAFNSWFLIMRNWPKIAKIFSFWKYIYKRVMTIWRFPNRYKAS